MSVPLRSGPGPPGSNKVKLKYLTKHLGGQMLTKIVFVVKNSDLLHFTANTTATKTRVVFPLVF